MAKKKKQQDVISPVDNVDQTLSRAEQYVEGNWNKILYVIGIAGALIAAYFGYQKYMVEPAEQEAQIAMYEAQQYFEQDSLTQALNGAGGNLGFLDIADEFGGTAAGNLANYYAGVCYLQLGDYSNAIAYLDDYSGNDGVFNVLAKKAIGDAFHELNQTEDALDYYTKAANAKGNEFSTPIALEKAAQTAEMLNKWDKALGFYQRLKNEFPDARQSKDVDKFIAYCEAKVANS